MPDTPIQDTLDKLGTAYRTQNLALALSTMDERVVWDISGPNDVPYCGVYYGHEGFSRFWWLLGTTVAFHEAGAHTTLYGDGVAVALGGECGSLRATNRTYHYDWAVEYRFGADARIVTMRQYWDPGRIHAALGSTLNWPGTK
uniref:nuclear transport factor 2 family protein n=1 Tax=Cupriavidus yeoncheonensis TaxID=1462994 RepID=UPI003F4992BB